MPGNGHNTKKGMTHSISKDDVEKIWEEVRELMTNIDPSKAKKNNRRFYT